MEIHQFPPSTVHPLRAPSKTEDGNSSSSGNFYHRPHKQSPQEEEPDQQGHAPGLEGPSTIIDIRV